ncbi:unnamed protein product, partial [Nesidiocoris tenuis]
MISKTKKKYLFRSCRLKALRHYAQVCEIHKRSIHPLRVSFPILLICNESLHPRPQKATTHTPNHRPTPPAGTCFQKVFAIKYVHFAIREQMQRIVVGLLALMSSSSKHFSTASHFSTYPQHPTSHPYPTTPRIFQDTIAWWNSSATRNSQMSSSSWSCVNLQ